MDGGRGWTKRCDSTHLTTSSKRRTPIGLLRQSPRSSRTVLPMSATAGHDRELRLRRSGQLGGNNDSIPVSQGRDDAMHKR
ncbi:hypothetical protein T440DRAFT_544235 [Plenodomus tracheiphilus IPT5]|uniref:Uncharacterized protein n=1 Tax=Plenodomus tracheiphilus IPT5 TaxID=1408161 RepID=A0A6A7BF14_9PLEO|nr:hypothetical protein T440DRAFT_544235 [Plenodomus tracheiphilus IPT5]